PSVGRSGDHHFPVGRRDDEAVVHRHGALWIAEEVSEEPGQRGAAGGPPVALVAGENRRGHQRGGDEGSACFVDFHANKKGRPDGGRPEGPFGILYVFSAATHASRTTYGAAAESS